MACTHGSEKKFSGDSTITTYPYEGLNLAAQAWLLLAAVPSQVDFNADEVCSGEPPEYQTIEALELTVPPIVYEKTINNMRRRAWFQGCQCKLPPREPVEEPTPPDPDPNNPQQPNETPFSDPCFYTDGIPRYIVQYKLWYSPDGTEILNYDEPFLDSETGAVTLSYESWGNGRNKLIVRKVSDGSFVRAIGFSDVTVTKARVIYCDGGNPPDREEPEDTPFPDFPDFCEATDCLKQPDKVEILSTLQLYISESNNRIRDELLTAIEGSAATILSDADTKSIYLAGLMSTLDDNARLYRDDIKLRITESKNDTVTALKDWIDGAKNQIIASVGASTAAILAGVATATGTITAAIATSTATITGSITTATTTLTTALSAARDNIKDRIKDAEDKVIEDLTKEAKKGRYRYRVLIIDITSFPTGLSYTVGRNGAPDKYAFGWIQWRRVTSGSNVAYTERQFICNVKGVFVSPFPNEDVTAVIHLQPSVSGSSVLTWSNNEFTE